MRIKALVYFRIGPCMSVFVLPTQEFLKVILSVLFLMISKCTRVLSMEEPELQQFSCASLGLDAIQAGV